jgi:hypothetical protein
MNFRRLILSHLCNILLHYTIWILSNWLMNFHISLCGLSQYKRVLASLTRAKSATSNLRSKSSHFKELDWVRAKWCGQSQAKHWLAKGVLRKALSSRCVSWTGSKLGNKTQLHQLNRLTGLIKQLNPNQVPKQDNLTRNLTFTLISNQVELWQLN